MNDAKISKAFNVIQVKKGTHVTFQSLFLNDYSAEPNLHSENFSFYLQKHNKKKSSH